MFKTFIITIALLTILALVAAWYFIFQAPVVSVPTSHTQPLYASQQDCEQKTRKSCGFTTCDYIPEGKTFEEVCGEGFTDGWMPAN